MIAEWGFVLVNNGNHTGEDRHLLIKNTTLSCLAFGPFFFGDRWSAYCMAEFVFSFVFLFFVQCGNTKPFIIETFCFPVG